MSDSSGVSDAPRGGTSSGGQRRRQGPPVIVLVGPPASGKTTVGTAIAHVLGAEFRDTDRDIEESSGMSVSDIFVEHGEPHFRALEEQAVARALVEHDGVLALGGGSVTSAATRELLVGYARDGGTVVWLDVDLRSAAKRVGLSRDRPLLTVNPRAMLRTMLEQRAPLYGEVSTCTVVTSDRDTDDVVADILAVVAPGGADR
jgi:shikimate kinase